MISYLLQNNLKRKILGKTGGAYISMNSFFLNV